MRIHWSTEYQTKDIANLFVQFLCSYFTLFYQFQVRESKVIIIIRISRSGRQSVRPGTKFQVHTIVNSLFGVVHTSPVGHYNAIKTPFITKNIFKQTFVVTSVLSLIKIIRAHNRPCSTFLNSRFKSRQVYFIKSTITQLHISGMTVELLIVQCIMLHTGSYPVLLYTFDVRNHHSGG